MKKVARYCVNHDWEHTTTNEILFEVYGECECGHMAYCEICGIVANVSRDDPPIQNVVEVYFNYGYPWK